MRLIDADKLKETLLHYNYTTEHNQIFRYINEQPTAYDIDKVVEELEKIRAKKTCSKEKCDTKEICRICVVDDLIEIVKQGGVGKDDDMSKEEICEKVRSICKEENVEFLFITEGKSCWSVSKNEHIRKVAHFHKENENKCATDRAEVKGNGE